MTRQWQKVLLFLPSSFTWLAIACADPQRPVMEQVGANNEAPPTAMADQSAPDPGAAKQQPDNRLPVPGVAAKSAANAKIRELFAEELAIAKSAPTKAGLAKNLVGIANDTDDTARRFALLETAIHLADEAGDCTTLMEVLETTQRDFQVNLASRRRNALISLAKRVSPTDANAVTRRLISEANSSIDHRNHTDAFELSTAAGVACRRGREPSLQQEVNGLVQEIKTLKRLFPDLQTSVAKLASAPADRDACGTIGRFLCFSRNQWDRGLPLLAKSTDVSLADVAKQDLLVAKMAPAISLVPTNGLRKRKRNPKRCSYQFRSGPCTSTSIQRRQWMALRLCGKKWAT